MNSVKIIADSKSPHGQRLITAVLTFPRYLLAEVNTHRVLSRNSASSRAIRFEKMVQSVMENPFIPFKWQKDHSGMQGVEYITNPLAIKRLETLWLEARDSAVEAAKALHILKGDGITSPKDYLTDFDDDEEINISKQICNRLLEPFMYHTALVSGTELENFFALRAQDAAEIHFQDLAYKFLDACNESTPKQLKAGEWHIPYGDDIDSQKLHGIASRMWDEVAIGDDKVDPDYNWYIDSMVEELKVKIATVRAARISYAVPGSEMKHDYEADLKLHDRLASSGHWSAFEHCAKAMTKEEYGNHLSGVVDWKKLQSSEQEWPEYPNSDSIEGWCGNFRGFIQYRKMFSDENRSDSRLIQK